MKKFAGFVVALAVLAAGLIAFGALRSTPASAEPLDKVCICHATQQNKVEGNTGQDPNENQKYILICPNGNSNQVKGHASHPDDVIIPQGEACPIETPEPPED